MSGSIIDTNVIIKLLNGDNTTADLFDSLSDIHISVITAGELFYGAQKSSRMDENVMLFRSFLSEFPLVEIDEGASEVYGQIKANLVKRGVNIPENDIWIAAVAINRNFELVTYDEHFKNINDLRIK